MQFYWGYSTIYTFFYSSSGEILSIKIQVIHFICDPYIDIIGVFQSWWQTAIRIAFPIILFVLGFIIYLPGKISCIRKLCVLVVRNNHSTQKTLIILHSKRYNTRDSVVCVIGIFMDFPKTFHTVHQVNVFDQLHHFGTHCPIYE